MRLEQIGHFLAVVDSGSLREAARRAGISQPAMSKSIRLLEQDLATQLFRRSTRGIEITETGKAFAVRARAIQGELRKAREEITQSHGDFAPSVAIGLGQSSAILILPRALQHFRALWPQARIRVMEGLPEYMIPYIRDETLDFALGGATDRADVNIAFTPLFRSARVVAGRKNHPLRRARNLAALQHVEWIRTPPLEGSENLLEEMFVSHNIAPPSTVISCESYHTATSLLASSDMLALMSRRQLASPFSAKFLREIPITEPIRPFTVGIFTRVDVPLSPAAAAFAKIVTTVARTLASSEQG